MTTTPVFVSDTDRENISRLLQVFSEQKIVSAEQFMDGFNTVLNRMKDLEVEVRRGCVNCDSVSELNELTACVAASYHWHYCCR